MKGKGVSSRERRGHELRRGVDGKNRNPKREENEKDEWARNGRGGYQVLSSESEKGGGGWEENTSITHKVRFRYCIKLVNRKLTQSASI